MKKQKWWVDYLLDCEVKRRIPIHHIPASPAGSWGFCQGIFQLLGRIWNHKITSCAKPLNHVIYYSFQKECAVQHEALMSKVSCSDCLGHWVFWPKCVSQKQRLQLRVRSGQRVTCSTPTSFLPNSPKGPRRRVSFALYGRQFLLLFVLNFAWKPPF